MSLKKMPRPRETSHMGDNPFRYRKVKKRKKRHIPTRQRLEFDEYGNVIIGKKEDMNDK